MEGPPIHVRAARLAFRVAEASSSHLPDDVRALGDLSGEVLAIVPDTHLVSPSDDQLTLFFIALLRCFGIMRRAVAEYPEAGLVIEVRLAVETFDALLRCIRQSETVF